MATGRKANTTTQGGRTTLSRRRIRRTSAPVPASALANAFIAPPPPAVPPLLARSALRSRNDARTGPPTWVARQAPHPERRQMAEQAVEPRRVHLAAHPLSVHMQVVDAW